MVKKFMNLVKSLLKNENSDEAYLAQSVDIYDLENRMKKLEKGTAFRSKLRY